MAGAQPDTTVGGIEKAEIRDAENVDGQKIGRDVSPTEPTRGSGSVVSSPANPGQSCGPKK